MITDWLVGLEEQGITKVHSIHPVRTMNVCRKFHDNLSSSCWDISAWIYCTRHPPIHVAVLGFGVTVKKLSVKDVAAHVAAGCRHSSEVFTYFASVSWNEILNLYTHQRCRAGWLTFRPKPLGQKIIELCSTNQTHVTQSARSSK